MKRIIYIFVAFVLLAGCSNNLDEIDDVIETGQLIAVAAGIQEMQVSTRSVSANAYSLITPTASANLDAAVWFSTSSGSYTDGGSSTALPRHSEVNFTSGTLTFPTSDVLPYPNSGSVYAVGLYPKSGWTGTTTATHSITGGDDLMFAPQISATSSSHFDSSDKKLSFSHLLTWVKVLVCANDQDALTSWGNIINISITTPNNSVIINLSDAAVTYTGGSSEITALDVSTPLSTTTQEMASVFCAPATTYTIKVKSANVTEGRSAEVQLMNAERTAEIGSAADAVGKVFVLTLYLDPFKNVNATGTMSSWDDTYTKIYPDN